MAKKGTVTELSSIVLAEEAEKASKRVLDKIAECHRQLHQLEGFFDDNTSLINLIRKLPDETHHNIMVPFGKAAFFPGRMTNPNKFVVFLGEGYYAERSAKQTVDILKRRSKNVESQIGSMKAIMQDLEYQASFFENTAHESKEGVVEIREDYIEEAPSGTSPTHGHTKSDFAPSREVGNGEAVVKDDEYAHIFSRMDELEREEEEAEEANGSDEDKQIENEQDNSELEREEEAEEDNVSDNEEQIENERDNRGRHDYTNQAFRSIPVVTREAPLVSKEGVFHGDFTACSNAVVKKDLELPKDEGEYPACSNAVVNKNLELPQVEKKKPDSPLPASNTLKSHTQRRRARREDQIGRLRRPRIRGRIAKRYSDGKISKLVQLGEGSRIRNMAEAEILLAIEELDSFLMKYNESRDLRIMELVTMANKVRNDLRLILDFLSDKKLEEGSSLKNWISDVVEIARDAHLINDARFLINDIDLTKWFRPISRVLGQTRKHILQLGVEGAKKPPITSQEGGGDEYVVGLDQDTEFVLGKWIFRDRGELHTMCIVGMPGVGKTTLARKIYNHTAVVNRYKLRAWVCNYGESSKKEVLMKLILQVADSKDRSVLLEEMENAENYSLQQLLQQHLKGKQFLIVFDDIGKFPYFESIVEALPREDKQSKLLLTSRFRSIMHRVSTYPEVYTMKPLDDDRSWQLFFKLLLLEHQEFPKKLEREGRDMLRSCDGLPLSIKEVTTHCVTKKQSGSEWEQLLEPIELSTTLAVLESVYQRWSQQLKFCFLCLSFFKKGTPIRREKLIQVWTAGQVILQKEKEDEDEVLKEVESYSDCLEGYKTSLMKLVDESIIEVDIRKYQSVKRIRINSSFHKLCIKKAKEEMIFGTLMKGESNPPSGQEPYHRAIYCSRDEFNHFKDHDKHLISLFFCGGG